MPKRPKVKRATKAPLASKQRAAIHSILVGIHTLSVEDPYVLAACCDWVIGVLRSRSDGDHSLSKARRLLLEPQAVGELPFVPASIDRIIQNADELQRGVLEANSDASLRAVVA